MRPAESNPMEQAINDVGKHAQVKMRVEALRRWRNGVDILNTTPGDRALAEAEEMQGRIENGDMPSALEIDQMLASTNSAFKTLPDRGSKLDAGNRGLVDKHPEWFEQDDEGYLRRKAAV